MNNTDNRGSVTERIGVYLTGLRITKLGWAFRETTVLDYGIDATIEQRVNDIPTGKLLSMQIKTGESFVKPNAKGDFDYYIKPVHYEYWLKSQIPVLMVLCDPDKEVLYWQQIAKRNLIRTSEGRYKISIAKTAVLNNDSLPELEAIINTYAPSNNYDIDIENITAEGVTDYAMDLLKHSRESLSFITQSINKYQDNTEAWKNGLMRISQDLESGFIKSDIEKQQRIQDSIRKYKVATDIFTQRLVSPEKIIAIETHSSAFCFIDKLNSVYGAKLQSVSCILKNALNGEFEYIEDVINLLKKLADRCNNPNDGYGKDLVASMKTCSIAIQDYMFDLIFFNDIIKKQISKLG